MNSVKLEITWDQGLVLLDYMDRILNRGVRDLPDDAVKAVFESMECDLEQIYPEQFAGNWAELVAAAKMRLTGGESQ